MLREGMSADDEHPLVKERPDLFTDEGPEPDLRVERPKTGRPKVETAARTAGGARVEVNKPASKRS
jgi:hypothetical protein